MSGVFDASSGAWNDSFLHVHADYKSNGNDFAHAIFTGQTGGYASGCWSVPNKYFIKTFKREHLSACRQEYQILCDFNESGFSSNPFAKEYLDPTVFRQASEYLWAAGTNLFDIVSNCLAYNPLDRPAERNTAERLVRCYRTVLAAEAEADVTRYRDAF